MKPNMSHKLRLCFICSLLLGLVTGQSVELKGTYHCDRKEDGNLHVHFRAVDTNEIATDMKPIDGNDNDIETCISSGAIRPNDPYVVDITVTLNTNAVTNDCGMTVLPSPTSDPRSYIWRFRARRTIGGQDIGNKHTLVVNCTTDDLSSTQVHTVVEVVVPKFTVEPVNDIDRTVAKGVRTDAELKYTGYLYPEDETGACQDAKGLFFKDCYSGTNMDVTENAEKFINSSGCRIPGAAYAPTNDFQQTSAAGERPIRIEASVARAQEVGAMDTIYFKCKQGCCLTEDDPNCIKRCGSTPVPGSTIDTVTEHRDYIIVKDELAQTLFGVFTVHTDPALLITATHGEEGQQISLIAKGVPGGEADDDDLEQAKGFFVYNCRYSLDEDVPNGDSVVFVDNQGCVVPGTDMSPDDEFVFNQDLSSGSVYYLVSGRITLKKQDEYRVYCKCFTGICLTENHPFCIRRCGQTGSQANVRRLQYRGLYYSIAIVAPNDPPLALQVTGDSGNVDLQTEGGFVGDSAGFGAEIIPTTSDDPGLQSAAGAYLYSCLATDEEDSNVPFIDEKGCRIADSKYATNKECEAVSNDGLPPFKIDCGNFVIPQKGDVDFNCSVGYCKTANKPSCTKRCNNDPDPGDATVVNAGLPVQSGFTAKEKPEEKDRTAIISERIRAIIIALTTILPAAILAGVAIGACCLIKAQMAKKKFF